MNKIFYKNLFELLFEDIEEHLKYIIMEYFSFVAVRGLIDSKYMNKIIGFFEECCQECVTRNRRDIEMYFFGLTSLIYSVHTLKFRNYEQWKDYVDNLNKCAEIIKIL